MNKKTAVLLIITVLITTGIGSQAICDNNIKIEEIIVPYYETSCMDSPDGIHHMECLGRAFVYYDDEDYFIENGNTYQCEYCDSYFVCTGSPHLYNRPIEYYLEDGYLKLMNWSGIIYTFKSPINYADFTDETTLEGYKFR